MRFIKGRSLASFGNLMPLPNPSLVILFVNNTHKNRRKNHKYDTSHT